MGCVPECGLGAYGNHLITRREAQLPVKPVVREQKLATHARVHVCVCMSRTGPARCLGYLKGWLHAHWPSTPSEAISSDHMRALLISVSFEIRGFVRKPMCWGYSCVEHVLLHIIKLPQH